MSGGSDSFRLGEVIDGTKYRVEALIGTGGMGSVYRVEHTELGRRFVLKALRAHLASRDDLVARLRNEWRALGKLEHSNIVQVTDAGKTASSLPYYVMENLRGHTLGEIMMAEGRLSVHRACTIAGDILAGLHAAHETGAVHRDIKPPNIFVDESGVTKLLDFGIAKLRDQSAKVVTAGGVSIGTPRYMAPEQAEGAVVDGRADIYATALVLYEMVVGKGPFGGIKDPNELVMAHISRDPERADFMAPDVPEEFADLLQRWLSKSPGSRPPNADLARQELLSLRDALGGDARAPDDDVTWGGAYDAATMGADALPPSQRRAPETAAGLSPTEVDADTQVVASSRDASGGGSSEVPAPSMTRTLSSVDARARLAPAGPGGTLAWGTDQEKLTDEDPESVQPNSRAPGKRRSVTPPPVSSRAPSLRPGPRARGTIAWIGATALVSFLLAWGVSQLVSPQLEREEPVSGGGAPEDSTTAAPTPEKAEPESSTSARETPSSFEEGDPPRPPVQQEPAESPPPAPEKPDRDSSQGKISTPEQRRSPSTGPAADRSKRAPAPRSPGGPPRDGEPLPGSGLW